eukprot:CAMPEP_0167765584 /NCGR_PEP_ID=MMETSP0110_2-20121227/14788_1 /TAXON_ID=629695 /ORGANISM="Gymnochlora sp., Strain CCMP2014" /LENGTH=172 /DNA_ID=CAMNT_0007653353 /DNA_START=835 /DNA_END=1349 /DNA_ORIENTATION=+
MTSNIRDKSLGIFRNIFWASVAVSSTFILLIMVIVVDEVHGFVVGILLDFGLWDMLANITSINLCWPLCFYTGVLRKLVLREETKSAALDLKSASGQQSRCNSNPPKSLMSPKSDKSFYINRSMLSDGRGSTITGIEKTKSDSVGSPSLSRPSTSRKQRKITITNKRIVDVR